MTEFKFRLNTGAVLTVKAEDYAKAKAKCLSCLYPHERIIEDVKS